MHVAPAIEVRDLVKHFKKAPPDAGLNGLSFAVPKGIICGLIGPNGAGKTTTVRVLSTLTRADSGSARVAGFDVASEDRRVRENIGFVGQQAAVDEILDGRQNLVLFARLRRFAPRDARRAADELLERFGLTEAGKNPVSAYSGGMRRRLDLALGLLTDPAVLFVDEPTTGLDPMGRREVWAALAGLAERGTTILLTTHMLDMR